MWWWIAMVNVLLALTVGSQHTPTVARPPAVATRLIASGWVVST